MSHSNYPNAEEFVARAGFGPKVAVRIYSALFWLNALLLGGGLVGIYLGFIGPWLETSKPLGWVETAGTVESSDVVPPPVGRRSIQAVEVAFRYQFTGQDYSLQQRIELAPNAASGLARHLLRSQLAPGSRVTCWLNPKNPSEARVSLRVVANQTPAWLRASPSLMLMLVGLVGMYRSRSAASRVQPESGLELDEAPKLGSGDAPLAASGSVAETGNRQGTPPHRGSVQGPEVWSQSASSFNPGPESWEETVRSRTFAPWPAQWVRLVLVLAGIGVLIAIAVAMVPAGGFGGRVDSPDWWDFWPLRLGLAALSLFLMALCGYFLLAFFNPRPWFQVNSRNLVPGQTLEIEWRIRGRADRLQRLRFYLEGMETTFYRRGTNWAMKRQVFDRFVITEAVDADLIRAGRTSLRIPMDLIPSFDAEHNKIEWVLRLQGEIPRWPDLKESMPVLLLPPSALVERPPVAG